MNNQDFSILVVDDEEDIIEFLSYNLKKEGFTVYTASNGKDAIKIASHKKPNLILLDVMMPEMDGIETCEEIRANSECKNCIIAFLTARNEDYSEIAGFKAGADDYIAKPIRPKVLIARISGLLKRAHHSGVEEKDEKRVFQVSDLTIDVDRHIIIFNNTEHNLPNKEFKLLLLLCSKPERVFTRDEIFNNVWGSDVVVGEKTIDVHIRKLRERFGDDCIQTIKGIGYKFVSK